MPVENLLAHLRASSSGARRVPPVVVIFGPHAFLREYALESIVRPLIASGFGHAGFQVGAGDDYGAVLNEMRAPDLFAPKRVLVSRVLRSRRGGDSEAETDSRATGSGGGEGALIAAIEDARGPSHLVLLYERDNAPAKVRRAAEKTALLINCMRPFDNQIEQYVAAFAHARGLKLPPAATEILMSRHGGDLAAISNALDKVTIFNEPGQPVRPADLDEPGAQRMPEVFELAESLARGRGAAALAQLDRSLALGRDSIEILALEVIPLMRRMMIAAALLAARRSSGEISSALGLPPQSGLSTRAIEGARRFGLERLQRVYWRACELDAGFKNGELKEREQALAGLVLDLMGSN